MYSFSIYNLWHCYCFEEELIWVIKIKFNSVLIWYNSFNIGKIDVWNSFSLWNFSIKIQITALGGSWLLGNYINTPVMRKMLDIFLINLIGIIKCCSSTEKYLDVLVN